MTRWHKQHFTDITGLLLADESLSKRTWLGVGGMADLYFEPHDEADLARFLQQVPAEMPITMMGAGSNMLVRDGGIEGCVIKLQGSFSQLSIEGDDIIAGAGITDAELARYAAKNGRGGLSFLVSIPGTIGGGLRMNAGCYGTEFKDVVQEARLMAPDGTIHHQTPQEMGMAYRHSDVPANWIFLSARFATKPAAIDELKAEMKQMLAMRAETQPQGVRTGGSTFANPDGGKAWQVIDNAGCRGLQIGEASMSDKHCNFMINQGAATAHDLEALGEEVRAKVKQSSGIDLRWEIKILGRPLDKKTAPSFAMTGDKHD